MLAGSIYFYKNEVVVEEMDMEDYYDLSDDEITAKIEVLKSDRVVLVGFTNNHQIKGSETILYKEKQ